MTSLASQQRALTARERSERQAALDDAKAGLCAPADAQETQIRVELTEFRPQCRKTAGAGWFCGTGYKPRSTMYGRRLREWCEAARRPAAS